MNKYLDETGLAYFWGKIKSAMPAAQVQADWNQTNTSAADYIKNKPSIPTIPDLTKGTTTGNGNAVTDISVSGHTITLTKGTTFLTSHQDISGKQDKVAKLGSSTKPLYTSAIGTFSECSTYAGGTAVTLNGSDKGGSTASFYAPTAAGTSGQILTSNGSGAPQWANKPTYAYSEISYPVNTTTANGVYTGNITIDGTKPLHVIAITGNVTVTLSANPSDGHSSHVIFTSTAARTITINHNSTSMVCPEAENVALSLTANGYVEVDFLSANNKIFVRGV